MMELGLVVIVAVVSASYLLIDRKDQRHRQERAELYQRIQAPELAVAQHAEEHVGPAETVLPLTDQESANEELQAVLERMERIENGGLVQ